jgi:hypothetical protein
MEFHWNSSTREQFTTQARNVTTLPLTRFEEMKLPEIFSMPNVLFGIVVKTTLLQLLPTNVLRSNETDAPNELICTTVVPAPADAEEGQFSFRMLSVNESAPMDCNAPFEFPTNWQ